MLNNGIRIWHAFEAGGMRLLFDGLAARVQQGMGRDPYSGECFVFRGNGAGKLKGLQWDGTGFWIHYRRNAQNAAATRATASNT